MLARPANNESAPLLKLWIVGQADALAAMLSGVVGIVIPIAIGPFEAR